MSDTPSRLRSPPYPSMTLSRAVERAAQLYAHANRHPVPLATAAKAWEMSETSSSVIQTAAALLHYGLASDEGSAAQRRIRLSELALIVLKDEPGSTRRTEALKQAFLSPKVFREIWEKFGGTPVSDNILISYLTLERELEGRAPFTDKVAPDVVRLFRESQAYAGNPSAGEPVGDESTEEPTDSSAVPGGRVDPKSIQAQSVIQPNRPGGREVASGILSRRTRFRLLVEGPLGAEEIERLIRKLDLDKEFLAEDGDEEQKELAP